MKTFMIMVLGTFLILMSGFQPGERKQRKLQKEKEMMELIESGQFRFIARSARSSLGNFDNLSPQYDLKFDSLNIISYLPYYGRAYTADFSGEGGVKFDLKADNIKKEWNKKKKRYVITTEVSESRDSYSIFLTASLSGFADLQINFRNRQMISYYGIIRKLEED